MFVLQDGLSMLSSAKAKFTRDYPYQPRIYLDIIVLCCMWTKGESHWLFKEKDIGRWPVCCAKVHT